MCRRTIKDSDMPSEAPKIIVGLGNPGREYARNRHNVGYLVLDLLAREHGLSFDKRRGKAKLAIGRIGDQKVILVKPRTFMNESGRPVSSVMRFYKVPLDDLLVIFDDLDLPIGRIRMRPFGGTGGHKGMSSIIKLLGSNQFARLRVGIDRPPGKMDPAAYVLQNFSATQEEEMLEVRHRSVEAIEHWLTEPVAAVMNVVNSPPQVAGGGKQGKVKAKKKNADSASNAASAQPTRPEPLPEEPSAPAGKDNPAP